MTARISRKMGESSVGRDKRDTALAEARGELFTKPASETTVLGETSAAVLVAEVQGMSDHSADFRIVPVTKLPDFGAETEPPSDQRKNSDSLDTLPRGKLSIFNI